jgi:hypothetical protein
VDFLRTRAIPALALAAFTVAAHAADCKSVQGIYADDSVEKIDGSPRSLSSFAAQKDRSKLTHQEPVSGPKPSFGSSGQVMQRPKVTKLVSTVDLRYGPELKLRFLDESGKLLVESQSLTPRRWQCVNDRLERKFQMATGLGDIMRTEEVQQVLMAPPDGDLVLIESRKVIEGPKGPEQSHEVHFKRVKK